MGGEGNARRPAGTRLRAAPSVDLRSPVGVGGKIGFHQLLGKLAFPLTWHNMAYIFLYLH